MPAFTIAAAWRYALTGVGAAMAPGSQKWNGMSADFEIAPMRTRTIAVAVSGAPSKPVATISDSRPVPYWTPRRIIPTNIASPPKVVTTRACSAALRDCWRPAYWPISR